MACPLVQVGAVDDVAQHVLAPLGHFVGDDVGRDVGLGFALMVVLLVQPLCVETKARHGEKLTPLLCNAGDWMITSGVFFVLYVEDVCSYQSLVLLLLPTAHNLGEVHQGSSHVVALSLLVGLFVLGLVSFKLRRILVLLCI